MEVRQRAHLLLIAEKPSLMNKIRDVYNAGKWNFDITFTSAAGHLLQFKEPDKNIPFGFEGLPIFPDKWEYVVTGAEKLKQIREAYKNGKYTGIIHAGDPDTEGEVLIREILDYLKVKIPVYRFFTNDITPEAIKHELLNLRPLNTPLFERLYMSGYTRAKLDWMVGMNFSRAYSDKLKTGVAIGRVMTAILNIIVTRDLEIENFKDEVAYGVIADFNTFKGTLLDNGKPARFDTQTDAQEMCDSGQAKVVKIDEKETVIEPDKFYNLSSIQKETAKYGMNLELSGEVLQSLYQKEVITYHRSDCEYLNGTEDFDSALAVANAYFNVNPDKSLVLNNKKYINPEEFAKAGHSAIIPTGKTASLTKDEEFVFKLICRRFISAFLLPAKVKKQAVLLQNGNKLFKAEGAVCTQEGFKSIYEPNVYPKTAVPLPELKLNELYNYVSNTVEVHKPKPAPYTIGTLVEVLDNPLKFRKDLKDTEIYKDLKNLEKYTIGTPASRLQIIPKLISKGYVNLNNGKYTGTITGRNLIQALGDDPIKDVLLTGKWEMNLTGIRNGEVQADIFEKEVKSTIIAELAKIKAKTYTTAVGGKESSWACPKCGKVLSEKRLTLNCGCGFVFWKKTWGKELSERQINRILGGERVEVKGLKKKDGTKFNGELYLEGDVCKTKFL